MRFFKYPSKPTDNRLSVFEWWLILSRNYQRENSHFKKVFFNYFVRRMYAKDLTTELWFLLFWLAQAVCLILLPAPRRQVWRASDDVFRTCSRPHRTHEHNLRRKKSRVQRQIGPNNNFFVKNAKGLSLCGIIHVSIHNYEKLIMKISVYPKGHDNNLTEIYVTVRAHIVHKIVSCIFEQVGLLKSQLELSLCAANPITLPRCGIFTADLLHVSMPLKYEVKLLLWR